jgi:hypothetical protein
LPSQQPGIISPLLQLTDLPMYFPARSWTMRMILMNESVSKKWRAHPSLYTSGSLNVPWGGSKHMTDGPLLIDLMIMHVQCLTWMLKLTQMTAVDANQSIEVHMTHPYTRTPATHPQSTFETLPDQTCKPLTKSNSGHFSVHLFSKISVYRTPKLDIST